MTQASIALASFKLLKSNVFDLGDFSVDLNRFTMTNPTIKREVEKVQKKQRTRRFNAKQNLKEDIELFCRLFLNSWTLKDDKGKAVPVDKAPAVLLETDEGQELYYYLLELAKTDDAFEPDEDEGGEGTTDEDELKN